MWVGLKRVYYRYLLPRYMSRTVTHNYGELRLNVFLADPIAQKWYDKDMDERPEISLLKQSRLKPGALVFNLGAHHCVIAMTLANAVRPGGRVVALEASPATERVGAINCRANGYTDVELLNAAAAQSSGTVRFTPDFRVAFDLEKTHTIEITSYSVDDLAQRFGNPDVIYMDVEGYEALVLEGSSRTLQHSADWFIEVHSGHGLERFGGSVQSLLEFFPNSVYELYAWPEDYSALVRLNEGHPYPRGRFFLIARHS
jgi:FkbM family methyltransferase